MTSLTSPSPDQAHLDGSEAITRETSSDHGKSVSICRVTKRFGDVVAVDDVSLEINAGEFVALLGPSGSGKTTLLQGIAGFEPPSSGTILIGGHDFTQVAVHQRNLGMVFQKYTLFPHLTLRDNVAFPLKMRKIPAADRRKAADDALARVHLAGYGDRMPTQVSGGQQQRVALARAIVYQPNVLLMDEPLGALDRNLREQMQIEIKALQRELGITVIFVTHDQEEALTMADRVAVMAEGRLQQVATPEQLYEQPENLFVAGFVGDNNLLDVELTSSVDGCSLTIGRTRLDVSSEASQSSRWQALQSGRATLAIRPERIELAGPADTSVVSVILEEVVYSGQSLLLITQLDDGQTLRARIPSRQALAGAVLGDRLNLTWRPEAMQIFTPEAS